MIKSNINSGSFNDIEEGISHSENNKITFDKLSKKVDYKGLFIMNDPESIFDNYASVIFANLEDFIITDELAFRPEAISERRYDTPDLWPLVMRANKFYDPKQLKSGMTIKLVPRRNLNHIISIIDKNSKDIKKTLISPTKVNDRTLIKIT